MGGMTFELLYVEPLVFAVGSAILSLPSPTLYGVGATLPSAAKRGSSACHSFELRRLRRARLALSATVQPSHGL